MPADPGVAVRIYRPHPAQGAIVWLHGGGFVMGDLDTEQPAATRLADGSGAVVISVGYRRAPEHRFPAAPDDAYAVLLWTAEHAASSESTLAGSRSEVTVPARGSRPRWRYGPATSKGRRSAINCSTSPSSMTGKRPGRPETHRYAVDEPRQARRDVAALPGLHARHALRRTGAGRRPVRPATRLHRDSGIRPAPRRSHHLRAAPAAGERVRSSCTSGPAHSTGRMQSCPPRSRSGR